MRILVTGGAGFLGSHLCERLVAEGHEVLCYDSLLTGDTANIAGLWDNDRFTFVEYDVTNFIGVDGHLDWVMHFASPASPLDYLEHPIHTLKVGALGTLNGLGLAKAKGAGFFLASTSEVYGDPLVHPQPESYWGNVNPIGPRGVYDEAKRYGEAMTFAYHRVWGIPVRVVRIFNSILADQTVVAFTDGQMHVSSAESFDSWLQTEGWTPDEMLVPAFDPVTYKMELKKASAWIKHPSHQDAFELKLRYGRSVKVTGDHSIFVKGADGLPVAKPVREITVGDHVAIPAALPVVEQDVQQIDLARTFTLYAQDALETWDWVIGHPRIASVIEEHKEKLGLLLEQSGRYDGSASTKNTIGCALRKWKKESLLPLFLLNALGVEIPEDSRLGNFYGQRGWIPNRVPLTDDLLWLMGFYIAEGAEHGGSGRYFISMCSDVEYLERATSILESNFKLAVGYSPPSETRGPSIVCHSKPLHALFTKHLGLRQRRVPPWVMQLPLSRLKHFLEGFRCGDGTHSGKKLGNELCFDTTSQQLAIDLNYVLMRFGIVASWGRYETTFKAKYGDRRFPFYRLTICNLDNFDILSWDDGVKQVLNAKRIGDLVWSMVRSVEPCVISEMVYDFSVPGYENFVAGNGVSCHNTYGPRMRQADGRAVPTFISQALSGEPITVHGDGTQTRSLCFVSDLVEGFIRLLAYQGLAQPINIGNPHEVTVLQIAEKINEIVGSSCPIEFHHRPVDDPERRCPDMTNAKGLLDFEPSIDLDEGLKRTIEWCKAHWAGSETERELGLVRRERLQEGL